PSGGGADLTGVANATGGELVTLTVTPTNPAGDGPARVAHTILPFADGVEGFVAQQHEDLLGRPATVPEIQAATADILIDGDEPVALSERLLDPGVAHRAVEPVARLYQAYFLRLPDRSGLG